MTAAAPKSPMKAESRKPVRVRSVRYQIQGFARARVRESWRVDCQGSRRCHLCQPSCSYVVKTIRSWRGLSVRTYNGKSHPNKSADAPYNRVPIST
jgi:hypothetical protein